MPDNFVTMGEYNEFRARVADMKERQNKRLTLLEENVKQTQEMNASIQRLAVNMENMLKEQERQGKRLQSLEAKDGEMWRKMIGYVITTIVGLALGALCSNLPF